MRRISFSLPRYVTSHPLTCCYRKHWQRRHGAVSAARGSQCVHRTHCGLRMGHFAARKWPRIESLFSPWMQLPWSAGCSQEPGRRNSGGQSGEGEGGSLSCLMMTGCLWRRGRASGATDSDSPFALSGCATVGVFTACESTAPRYIAVSVLLPFCLPPS